MSVPKTRTIRFGVSSFQTRTNPLRQNLPWEIAVEELFLQLKETNAALDALLDGKPEDAEKNLATSKLLDEKRIGLEKQIADKQAALDAQAARKLKQNELTIKATAQADAADEAIRAAAVAGRRTNATGVNGG